MQSPSENRHQQVRNVWQLVALEKSKGDSNAGQWRTCTILHDVKSQLSRHATNEQTTLAGRERLSCPKGRKMIYARKAQNNPKVVGNRASFD